MRGEPNQAETILIEDQSLARSSFTPIQVHITQVRIFSHDGSGITRNPAKLVQVRPHDAEKHRKWDGRAEYELFHPHASFRERALNNEIPKLQLKRIACSRTFCPDNNLGMGRVG